MADTKIRNLPVTGSLDDDDCFVVATYSDTKTSKVKWSDMTSGLGGSGGGATAFYSGGSNTSFLQLAQGADTLLDTISLPGAFATNGEVKWTVNMGLMHNGEEAVVQLSFLKPKGEDVFYLLTSSQLYGSEGAGRFCNWNSGPEIPLMHTTDLVGAVPHSFGTDYRLITYPSTTAIVASMKFTKVDDDTLEVSIKEEWDVILLLAWHIYAEEMGGGSGGGSGSGGSTGNYSVIVPGDVFDTQSDGTSDGWLNTGYHTGGLCAIDGLTANKTLLFNGLVVPYATQSPMTGNWPNWPGGVGNLAYRVDKAYDPTASDNVAIVDFTSKSLYIHRNDTHFLYYGKQADASGITRYAPAQNAGILSSLHKNASPGYAPSHYLFEVVNGYDKLGDKV